MTTYEYQIFLSLILNKSSSGLLVDSAELLTLLGLLTIITNGSDLLQ